MISPSFAGFYLVLVENPFIFVLQLSGALRGDAGQEEAARVPDAPGDAGQPPRPPPARPARLLAVVVRPGKPSHAHFFAKLYFDFFATDLCWAFTAFITVYIFFSLSSFFSNLSWGLTRKKTVPDWLLTDH